MANTDNINEIISKEALEQLQQAKVLLDESTEAVKRFAQESKNIEIKLTSNTNNFTQLNENINSANANIQSLESAVLSLGLDFDKLTASQIRYAKAIENVNSNIGKTKTKIKDVSDTSQKASDTANDLSKSVDKANNSFNTFSGSMGRVESMLSRMAIRFALMATVFETVRAAATSVGNAFERLYQKNNFRDFANAEMVKASNNQYKEMAINLGVLKDRFLSAKASVDEKKKVVEQLNNSYGVMIGKVLDINNAEKFFRDKTSDFIQALNLRAKAEGALQAVRNITSKQLEEESNPEQVAGAWERIVAAFKTVGQFQSGLYVTNPLTQFGQNVKKQGEDIVKSNAEIVKKQIDYLLAEIAKFFKQSAELEKAAGIDIDAKKASDTSKIEYQIGKRHDEALRKRNDAEIKNEIDKNKRIIAEAVNAAQKRVDAINANLELEKKIIQNDAKYKIDEEKKLYDEISKNKKISQELKDEAEDTYLINSARIRQEANNREIEETTKAQKEITEIYKSEIHNRYQQLFTQIKSDSEIAQQELKEKQQKRDQPTFFEMMFGQSNLKIALKNIKEQSETIKEQMKYTQADVSSDVQKMAEEVSHGVFDPESKNKLKIDTSKLSEEQSKLDELKEKKKLEIKKEFAEKTINLAQQTADAVKTITDNQYDQELKNLERKSELIQINAQEEINAIQATQGFQVAKQAELNKINAQTAAQQEQIQSKEKEIEINKAKFDKSAAEAKIVEETAVAIMQAWVAADGNPLIAIPLTALIAGAGAAQLAAIASTPLPQYKEGTGIGGHKGGGMIVGDGGEPELIKYPSGQMQISPSKSTVMFAPKGTEVTPMSKLIRQANLMNNVGLPMIIAPVNDSKAVESKLDEVNEALQTLTYVTARKQAVVLRGDNRSRSEYVYLATAKA